VNAAVTQHIQSLAEAPTEWPAHYSDEDQAAVVRLVDWINAGQTHAPGYPNHRSQAKVARAIGVSAATLNSILRGLYPSPPTKHLQAALQWVAREAARATSLEIPFVETSVSKLVGYVCDRASRYRDIGILTGVVGTGKTAGLKRYAAQHAHTIIIEGQPDMNATALLRTLVQRTGAAPQRSRRDSTGTKPEMLAAIVEALRQTDRLLVIDEADKTTDQCLEYARRISDLAEIGLVLSGNALLRTMVANANGKHGQISSRVGFWPPEIKAITVEDAAAITRAAFAHNAPDVELTDPVLDACWQMCSGHARVLTKLIRNVIELGLQQGHSLSAELVFSAGQQLMGLKRPTGG